MIDLKTPPITPTRWSIYRDHPPGNRPLVVTCVFYGTKYKVEYVHKLKSAVERNLSVPIRFVCLSDREIDGVETVPLPTLDKKREGWWQKVWLFYPGLFEDGDRVLYFDLDVVITGDLDYLAHQWAPEPLIMIYNFGPNRGHCAHNSSVMLWSANDERLNPIFTQYANDSDKIMNALHGDQCWIWRVLRDNVANWPRDLIDSYKYDCRGKKQNPLSRVVVFHGDPKPDQCREPWVIANWL